jgi:hypothetical protein
MKTRYKALFDQSQRSGLKAHYRLTLNRAVRTLGVLTLLVLTTFLGCTKGNKDDSWEPTKLGRLALRLESKYKRELHLNPFSLHYTSVKPNTIIIKVQYQPNANLNLIYSVIDQATQLVHKLAADEFELYNIRVKSEVKPLAK